MDLSPIGKELYDSLYVNSKNIKDNEAHPLEKYVVAIDSSLDNNNLLRSIGERIGIYIGENEDASVILPIKLKEYLENEKDIQETDKKIEFTPDEYEKYLSKFGQKYTNLSREDFLPLYSNRLLNE
jgi:hypothetical protein